MFKVSPPVLLSAIIVFIGACTSQIEKQPACEASRHTKELRILMHKLDAVTFEPGYSELERDQYRMAYAEKIREIVEIMIARQHDKKAMNCGVKLSPQHKQVFKQYSGQLQAQTQQLVVQIELHQVERIKPQLNKIRQVCVSCHQQLGVVVP